eukprot:12937776-Ditylum_brightwellii.AAC.1
MRKFLTANGCRHPKSSIQLLYLDCSRGCRSLMSIKDTHTPECTSFTQYIQSSKDPLTELFHDTPSLTKKALMKYAKGHLASMPEETNVHRDKLLLAKPLHGIFFEEQRTILQVDFDQSW